MKYGIAFANTGPFTGADGLRAFATGAEAAGFDSVWTVEHVIYPDSYESAYPYNRSGKMGAEASTPLPDPLVWLSFVAAATDRLKVATGILILPQRNPLVLAKEVATLDSLSAGRALLGIGVGWLREEFDALGVSWERRGARTDEYIRVLRELWAADHVSYDGEFTSFANVSSNPKPHHGTVPIVIGGHSRAAAERAGRLGDGFFPGKGDIAELVDIVRQTAADAGRDPSAIEISYADADLLRGGDRVEAAQALAAKGVDRAIVPAFMFMEDLASSLADWGENVIAPTA